MTNWTKSAEDNLVNELPSGRVNCAICNKTYKHKGTLKNHLHDQHPGEIILEAEKIADLHKEVEMRFNHKLLFTYPAEQITQLTKETTKTKERLITSFSYYLDQCAEELIKNEERIHLMVQTRRIIEQQENVQDIYVGLCNFRDSLKDEVIDRFPHHNCTNEISNIVDRLKMEAKAEFVRSGFSGGFLVEMIRCADKLSNWDDKGD